MENRTNVNMLQHLAWFDAIYPPKEATEQEDKRTKINPYDAMTYEQILVSQYHKSLNHRRDISKVSYQEAQFENLLITWEQYEQHIKAKTLTYPFKVE